MSLFPLVLFFACNPSPSPKEDSEVTTIQDDADGDGFTVEEGDCNDSDAAIFPQAAEICDGLDNNCNDATDEGVSATFYLDGDKDGYGDPAGSRQACAAGDGYVSNALDCDDAEFSVHPGASEVCNLVDDDCDGAVDNGVTSLFYDDADHDGYGDPNREVEGCELGDGQVANGSDCDDANASSFPGNPEICDQVDNDCDGQTDDGVTTTFWADVDGDSWGNSSLTQEACARPAGYSAQPGDCDDAVASIYPGATEVCNEVDDNCDGTVDEAPATVGSWYEDGDGDGFGDASVSVSGCSAPPGFVADATDCNDGDASVFPGATEVCDSIDNDCDRLVDENAAGAPTWYLDYDGDGYGSTRFTQVDCSAPAGFVADSSDCDDTDVAVYPGAQEYCDGLDNDCDGTVDGPNAQDPGTWYADGDGDGTGNASVSLVDCNQPNGYVTNASDCDDSNALISPRLPERCNGYDDDCDSQTDENDASDASTWYLDSDGDGYGQASSTRACTAPSGYVANASDCNDTSASISPGTAESCNHLDDDCDGTIDNGLAFADAYLDRDADGWGDSSSVVNDCSIPTGYVAQSGDCNDLAPAISPSASESCNHVDDNCDGTADEGLVVSTSYLDSDGDGYGGSTSVTDCYVPSGYVALGGDCNDNSALFSPGVAESCNSLDDDCDGQVDDGLPTVTYYRDRDGDNYGDSTSTLTYCSVPAGYVAASNDCDDGVSTTNPGASELCNGVDDDCDGTADDGVLGTSAACTASDCSAIIAATPTAASGNYYLSKGTYYCNMTVDGGGWTRVKSSALVYGTGYDGTYYNTEGFTWDQALFSYASGSVSAHCVYPSSLTGCNNIGFQFGADSWGIAQNWGSSICGMATKDYTGATTYPGGYDFIISRSSTTTTIRVGTLEGISNCTTSDNYGTAYMDIYVRR